MNETTLKIAAAAFIHDIGKFSDRGVLDISEQYINDNSGLYLPFFHGRHSHYHAIYTAGFIETMKDYLPPEFNSPSWGEDDAFINLAAGHHKPETPLQWVVAIADRVSSGWDRDTFKGEDDQHVSWRDYKLTRLLPIFEQISTAEQERLNDTIDKYAYRYPLKPVSPLSIFPGLKEKIVPETNEAAVNEYAELYRGFIDGLKKLRHREENTALWFEHFESLMMLYTSCIPAARVGDVVPDVSLYDHSHTTAALAAAIYLYHFQTSTMTIEAVRSYNDNKFLLINGDFRGIQNFIFSKFTDSEKFRSKILRGRSFAVSLLTELAADLICREIGLPFTSVVLNAAGKFSIIAPNTEQTQTAILKIEKQINDWLIDVAFGETVINIAFQKATCNDFVSGNFSNLWEQFCNRMEEKKYSGIDMERYGGVVEGYLDRFINEPGKPAVCPVCGKRPAMRNAGVYLGEELSACELCRDHIFLGTNLVKKRQLAVTTINADVGGKENQLFEPLFGEYQISFYEDDTTELARKGQLLKFWDLSFSPEESKYGDSTMKFISGYIPRYTDSDINDDRIISSKRGGKAKITDSEQIDIGDPKSLNHIACMAKSGKPGSYVGTEALGVIKADVDHLGLLMAYGLAKQRFTLSRLATLSRQMNNYFSVYLPHLLETETDFNNTYTVFSGGDDLFLIGPWNHIVGLADSLNDSFSEFVCRNSEIHFSAGITLHKSHTPIHTMAEAAEQALEKSKSCGRNRLTLFSETAPWEVIEKLNDIEKIFEDWLDKGWISKAFFYRFNEFIKMAAKEKQVITDSKINMRDMACTKWRALLVYAAERNVAGNIKGDDRKNIVKEVTGKLTEWLMEYEGKLRIPLWKILYNRR